jgi:hypothetical protein
MSYELFSVCYYRRESRRTTSHGYGFKPAKLRVEFVSRGHFFPISNHPHFEEKTSIASNNQACEDCLIGDEI